MIEFITANFVPLMFVALFCFLLTGIPVSFGLAATGLFMGFIGIEAGLFPTNMFSALPLRVFGIMQNDTVGPKRTRGRICAPGRHRPECG